jgi:hypothetical protein
MKKRTAKKPIVVMTIGHSTRALDDFLHLLKAHGVTRLVDVRTMPRSRHNPQFNEKTLPSALKTVGIGYQHMAGLGGLRHPRPDSPNGAWRNSSFRGFADYMQKGPLQALDVVEEITGEPAPHTIGYCVGGTLLAITLAYLAAKGRERVKSMTLFTAQVDFTYAGDLKVFAADEAQIAMVERQMAERGYLEGKKMANAFNLLRSNDLIWPYVINNYLRGREPMPFDLLYWNSDATRMPKANHSFYLRECYLENDLAKGAMELAGQQIDPHPTAGWHGLRTLVDGFHPAAPVGHEGPHLHELAA